LCILPVDISNDFLLDFFALYQFPNKPLNQALKWMDSHTRGYSSVAGSYLVYVFDSTHNKALQLFDNARLQAYAQAAFLPAKVLAFFEELRVRTNKQFGAYIPALYKLIGQCRSRTMLTWLFVGAFTGFFAPILGNELRDHNKSGGDRRIGLEKFYILLCWAISGYAAWTVTFNSKFVLSYRPSVVVMSAVNAAMFVLLLLRFKLARYESEEQTEHVKTE
jgi:hypothetical protein